MKKNIIPVPALSLIQIECLVAEIADHELILEQMSAHANEKARLLDQRLAPIRAEAVPEIERILDGRRAVERSLEDKLALLRAWATAHKAQQFAGERRSIKLLRGTLGFRLTPPRVVTLPGFTQSMCARLLRGVAWGRGFLKPAALDKEAILGARSDFAAQPDRLAKVGLAIVQDDEFYVQAKRECSDMLHKR